jgi:glycerol-3-phosphate dehydrogenase
LFDEARLVTLHWQLRHRQDGRMLRCGVYDTDVKRRLLAGYDDGWLWVAPLEDRQTGIAIAERWRRAVLATGGFVDIGRATAAGKSLR